jgi:hypothetical protein
VNILPRKGTAILAHNDMAMDVITAFRQRGYNINFARNLIAGHLGITASSWDSFAAKFSTLEASDTEKLLTMYNEALLVGDKICSAYYLDDSMLAAMDKLVDSAVIESTSAYSKTYPFPLKEEELEKMTTDNKLVHKEGSLEDESNVVCLQFCNTETYVKTIELSTQALRDEFIDTYSDINTLTMKRNVKTQLFNSIIYNRKKKYVLICADIVGLSSHRDTEKALNRFTNQFKALLKHQLPHALDVFPNIEKFYKKSDGRIISVDFVTPSDNISALKIKGSERDIRRDTYHKAGEKEVDQLEKFKITKAWDIIVNQSIRLLGVSISLDGDKRLLHNGAALSFFSVKYCPKVSTFTNIFEKAFDIK